MLLTMYKWSLGHISFTALLRKVRGSKGFCQVETIPKIREKLGSGWVGQAPTPISFFWGGNIVFFALFLSLYIFPKFSRIFNLTKPLSRYCILALHLTLAPQPVSKMSR